MRIIDPTIWKMSASSNLARDSCAATEDNQGDSQSAARKRSSIGVGEDV
jgi:hypothetical protein